MGISDKTVADGPFSGSTSTLAIIGAAFFWLWMDSAVFSGTLLGLAEGGGLYAPMFLTTTIVTVVAFAVLLIGIRRVEESAVARRWRLLGVPTAACGVAGSALLLVAGSTGSLALTILGGMLNGACFALLNLIWGWVCVAQGHAKAILHISGAWALSLPFNLLFSVLPPIASGVVVALLPAMSALAHQMLCALQDKPVYRIEPQRREVVDVFGGRGLVLGFDSRLLALILVFCAAFGLMYSLQVVLPVPASGQVGPGSAAGVVGVRGLTALVFFVASLTVLRDRVRQLFKVCFYILVAGLAVMFAGVFVPEFRVASPLMVAIGYCGFDILVWTMVAYHGYATPNHPIRTIVVAMLAEQVGICAGALLGAGMREFGISGAVETGVIMALDLLAVAALVAYTEYGSRLWTLLIRTSTVDDEAFRMASRRVVSERVRAAASSVEEGEREEALDETASALDLITERYALTRRESEILGVFVQGRSMSYIAEKLFVSENTIKTHVRHAYTKCGVHNKQELIDLVEEARRQVRAGENR